MPFENEQIDTDGLPRVEAATFQALEPGYRRLMYWSNTFFFLAMLAGILVFLFTGAGAYRHVWSGVLLGIWGLATVIAMGVIPFRFRAMGYVLRQRDILFRKGVLVHTVTAIPFNRVQHCEIRQGPIEKVLNLATLKIYTAGGHSSDLSIQGISREKARKLKEFMMNEVSQDEQPES